jgi:hypothetical protein
LEATFAAVFLDFSLSFNDIQLGLRVVFWIFATAAYLWFVLASILLVVGFFLDPRKAQARLNRIPALSIIIALFGNALFLTVLQIFFSWANCTPRQMTLDKNGNTAVKLTMDLLPSVLCWEGIHQVG